MANDSKEYNLMMLGSFIDSIDDIRRVFGEEHAERFALRLVYYGVCDKKFCNMEPIINATLESIFPKIEKSRERMERTKKGAIRHAMGKKHEDEGVNDENMNT